MIIPTSSGWRTSKCNCIKLMHKSIHLLMPKTISKVLKKPHHQKIQNLVFTFQIVHLKVSGSQRLSMWANFLSSDQIRARLGHPFEKPRSNNKGQKQGRNPRPNDSSEWHWDVLTQIYLLNISLFVFKNYCCLQRSKHLSDLNRSRQARKNRYT